MLGKYVKVHVTNLLGSISPRTKKEYVLNYGKIQYIGESDNKPRDAYVMGMDHPVRNFDGRVIAVIHRKHTRIRTLVVAPKNRRYINNEIEPIIAKMEEAGTFTLDCFYEMSCGAVVFHDSPEKGRQFLLIKNNRSINWGYSKGHIEPGETKEAAALREVREETGLTIKLFSGFSAISNYSIQDKVKKEVTIFLGEAKTLELDLQKEEIEKGDWFSYREATRRLRFENDKSILRRANRFLKKRKPFTEAVNS